MRFGRGKLAAIIGVGLMCMASTSTAKKLEAGPPPAQVNAILACRAIAGGEARLACFDKNAAGLGDAIAKRDLVVFDRASVRKTKRGLFGFGIPNLGIFGDDNDEVEIKQIDGEVVSTAVNGDGGYIFRLADGSRWSQTDSKPFALAPRSGDKVVIKKGALGSYMLSVARQPGVKVKRIN
ncbi:MAG: hypothetical protein H0W65_04480 [Sphingomonas sp.]|uniref:hypothetical protein n=1 Tax=Sphingomonas sp. TaxID=28214 RepID=UPI0017E08AB1|nr:hypothetical protein [Sphingomonas sp.]MBA3666962.1 hypothetical protein [Sphingomonas sp.]